MIVTNNLVIFYLKIVCLVESKAVKILFIDTLAKSILQKYFLIGFKNYDLGVYLLEYINYQYSAGSIIFHHFSWCFCFFRFSNINYAQSYYNICVMVTDLRTSQIIKCISTLLARSYFIISAGVFAFCDFQISTTRLNIITFMSWLLICGPHRS